MLQQFLLIGTSVSIIAAPFSFSSETEWKTLCYVTPETKLGIARGLCTVIHIVYWLLGFKFFRLFFYMILFAICYSGTGATCCLEAIFYISFGPFHSFHHMYKGSQAHNTFWHLIDTSLLLFFSTSDIKLIFHSLWRECLLQISQMRPMVKIG